MEAHQRRRGKLRMTNEAKNRVMEREGIEWSCEEKNRQEPTFRRESRHTILQETN